MSSIILTFEEIQELTGYAQSAKQLAELKDRGFWRARLNAGGRVVLERAHYEAVCAGAVNTGDFAQRPTLQKLRPAA